MPIYEYRCEQCGHQFDQLQKLSDEPLIQCPRCHLDHLKKLVSAPSFKLIGEGWYETDFKRKKTAEDLGSDKAATTTVTESDSTVAEKSSTPAVTPKETDTN